MRRLRGDLADLWAGRLPPVCALRVLLWACTALWVPVMLCPGETTADTANFAAIRAVAAWLRVPALGEVAPAELLVALVAGAAALFSVVDYLWGGSRRSPARVYVAATFWALVAVGYLLATPRAYGTWLFVGIAGAHWWALARVRGGWGGE